MRGIRFAAVLIGLVAVTAACGPPAAAPGPEQSPAATAAAPGPEQSRAATAADYAWFEENGELTEGFCLTWVQGLTPEQVLKRIGARDLGRSGWRADGWFDVPGQRSGEAVVAVTSIGGWALMIEDNGVLCIDDEAMAILSKGTRLVSGFRNAEYDGSFALVEDGTVRVSFDPQDPTGRTGADPDRLLTEMDQSGLDLDPAGLDPADPAYADVPYTEAAFALTERITGARLTAGVLHGAAYRMGAVPDRLAGEISEVGEVGEISEISEIGEVGEEPEVRTAPS